MCFCVALRILFEFVLGVLDELPDLLLRVEDGGGFWHGWLESERWHALLRHAICMQSEWEDEPLPSAQLCGKGVAVNRSRQDGPLNWHAQR